MINFLREATRNTPRLRRVLSTIYGICVEPFISGYIWYMVKYHIFVERKEKEELRKLGFSNIRCYLSKSWRRGTELDQAHRRYYSAIYQNKPVFVKVAKNDATIVNEIVMAEYIAPLSLPFVIPTAFTKMDFMGDWKVMAVEFVEGIHSFSFANSREFERYCDEYLSILQEFEKHRIVHADIHPDNLVLDNDNKLAVIDFGISSIIGNINSVDYIARPGTHYREVSSLRIYDDAYSFVKMIEKMGAPNEMKQSDAYKKIVERIDRFTLNVDLNSK